LDISGEPHEIDVPSLNAYLVNGKNVLVYKRQKPLCDVPEIHFGNMPLDGGHLLMTTEEKEELVKAEPQAEKYIKALLDAQDFLNGGTRYCLWLVGISPTDLRKMPKVLERVEAVRKWRLASVAPSTQKFAATPALFRDKRLPKNYIVVPKVSSERRRFIPMAYLDDNTIVNDLLFILPNTELYHFGVLNSSLHMAWMRRIAGRLKSDYRYSKDLVYNNFPFPQNPTPKQIESVEKAAQSVLDARLLYPSSCLADLYDPNTMPPELTKAHNTLDKAVDACYGKTSFASEAARMEFLFELYDTYTKGF
jgi:hypothetical protein